MASFTTTRNLKLRVDSNLTANAKYNLAKIDDLASIFTPDSTDSVSLRARTDINLLPEDAATGGSGVGGTINLGTPSQYSTVNLYSTSTYLGQQASLLDQATGGTRRLLLEYRSTLNGVVDTIADRKLSIDLEGADRQLVLGQSLSLLGGFGTVLRVSGQTDVTLPLTGTLATLANPETLLNKVLDANSNTIFNLGNASIAPTAAIDYSKLNLVNSIVDSDVAVGASISYDKLHLVAQIKNTDIIDLAGIPYSKLTLTNSIIDADISSSAGLNYSKMNLSGSIVDGDVNTGANIAGTKISPNFGNQEVVTSDRLSVKGPVFRTSLRAASSGQLNDLLNVLPNNHGPGVLSNDGFGNWSWQAIAGTGTVTSIDVQGGATGLTTSGGPITVSGTINLGGVLNLASGGTAAVDAPTARINLGLQIGTNVQGYNLDLQGLSSLAGNGILTRTSAGNFTERTITGQAYLPVTNGNGVAGNPTMDLAIDAAAYAAPAGNDELLMWDVSASAHRKINVSDITALAGGGVAFDWTSSTSIVLTHGLGSRDVIIELYDNSDFKTVLVDEVERTTINTVTLTASVAPSGAGLRVLIKKI